MVKAILLAIHGRAGPPADQLTLRGVFVSRIWPREMAGVSHSEACREGAAATGALNWRRTGEGPFPVLDVDGTLAQQVLS